MAKISSSCILLFIFTVFAIPFAAFATGFERDLYFGVSNDADVTRLQEFLKLQGIYSGPVTGNFFSLTREGVKRFQEREGIAPAAGYFGPKTRGRANTLRSSETTATQKITELDLLIQSLVNAKAAYPASAFDTLIEKYRRERDAIKSSGGIVPPVLPTPPAPETPSAAVPSPPVANSTTSAETTTSPVTPAPKEFRISGARESVFPIAAVNPTKIGDLTIKNNLGESVLLSQIVVKLTDEMNSSVNRGRKVIFILRDGITTVDSVVSSTDFTFNSTVPQQGNPNTSQFGLSLPVTVSAGEERTYGLWVDNLDYVTSGTLTIEFDSLLSSLGIAPVGGFKFVLNRP